MKNIKGMDLQLFANNGETEIETEVEDMENNVEDLETESVEEPTKMDLLDLLEQDEEIKKQFQAEVDRSITRALQTRDKKHQEELRKQEQRANMTAEELQAEKERELAEREAQLQQYELRFKKVEHFKENNIPLELVDFVRVDDAEKIAEETDKLMSVINAQVEAQVKAKLRENGIGIDNEEKGFGVSLEDLSNMSIEEINAHWEKVQQG